MNRRVETEPIGTDTIAACEVCGYRREGDDREVRADAARHVSRERGHRVTFKRIDYRRLKSNLAATRAANPKEGDE